MMSSIDRTRDRLRLPTVEGWSAELEDRGTLPDTGETWQRGGVLAKEM